MRPPTAKHLESTGVPQWRTALSRLLEQRCPAAGEGYRWIVPPRVSRTTGKRTKVANRAASLGGERIAPLQGGGGGYLGARAGFCAPLKIGGVCALRHFAKTKGGANELGSARAKAGGRTRPE